MADTLNKSEFASRLGLSKARVSQLVKAGLPLTIDGRVPVVAAEAWIAENVEPGRLPAQLVDAHWAADRELPGA